jgi:hypothetical protein
MATVAEDPGVTLDWLGVPAVRVKVDSVTVTDLVFVGDAA